MEVGELAIETGPSSARTRTARLTVHPPPARLTERHNPCGSGTLRLNRRLVPNMRLLLMEDAVGQSGLFGEVQLILRLPGCFGGVVPVRWWSKERRPASCGEMQVQGLPSAP